MSAVQRKRDSDARRHVVDALCDRVDGVLAEMETKPRVTERRMTPTTNASSNIFAASEADTDKNHDSSRLF